MSMGKAVAVFLKQWSLLIGGIAVTGAASLTFGGKIPWSEGLVVLLTVSVVVAVIAYLPVANHEMRALADSVLLQGNAVTDNALNQMHSIAESVEVTASYTEELSSDPNGQIKGVIYNDIIRLVTEAKESVVVVVKLDAENTRTDSTALRKEYLQAIETRIEEQSVPTISYIRIYQGVTNIAASVSEGSLGGESLRHVTRVLEIRQGLDEALGRGRKGANPSAVSIMVTDRFLMDVSFMVVDGCHLAIEIDSIDSSGGRYAAGFLIIHDKGELIVPRILAHVAILKDHAHPITIKDLGLSVSAVRDVDSRGQA